MSCHIVSYHIISYHIMSCHVILIFCETSFCETSFCQTRHPRITIFYASLVTLHLPYSEHVFIYGVDSSLTDVFRKRISILYGKTLFSTKGTPLSVTDLLYDSTNIFILNTLIYILSCILTLVNVAGKMT